MAKLFCLLIALVTLAACSKDHDLDDYKQEQFQKDYAKVSAIQGRYSGSLKAIGSGKLLSALQITLRASAKSVSSGDSTSAQVQPKVTAEVEFAGTMSSTKVSVTNGTYIDQSHLFHAELPIPADASTQTPEIDLDITGTIDGDGFTGTIVSDGYEDEGGAFELTRDGDSLQVLTKSLNLGSDSLFGGSAIGASHVFTGTYTDQKGSLGATMTIAAPIRTRLQQVADLLVPSQEHFVTVAIAISNFSNLYFSAAEVDSNEQKLHATQIMSLQGGSVQATLNLSCDQFRLGEAHYNFSCTYLSNLLGQVAHLNFRAP